MVYITVVNLLAAFHISKAVKDGKEITPTFAQTSAHLRSVLSAQVLYEYHWLTYALSHPVPFQCAIKPRSANTTCLIDAAAMQA